MAIRPLNSVAGFSVGETPANIILANGDITTTNITTTGVSNLNSVGNVKITGGTGGQVLSTDGSGNLSFITIGTASLNNGTSNVTVLNSGNITFSVAGNANVGTVTGTGLNVAGYLNATGNANVGNLGTAGLIVATGNITGGNLVTGGALSVTGNANVGNLGTAQVLATANVTAPQLISNTSTGTAPLVVSSTTLVSNLNADLLDGYNTATANTASTVVVRDTNGNVSANYFIGDGSQLTGIGDAASIANGTSNVRIPTVNGNVNISSAGNANIVVVTGTGVNVAGTLNATGNANVGNIGATNGVFTNVSGNGSALSSITGANVTGTVANATFATSAGSATTAGTVTTNAQPNITSVGTLTSLTATGNVAGGNLTTGGQVAATGNVTGGNLVTAGNVFAPAIVQNASTYDTRVSLSSGAGIVEITSNGNSTQFGPSGTITLQGASQIVGGTFGGSGITLGGSQTDIFQNRGGNVTVQVGAGGTIANTWTFAQNGSFTSPGNITTTANANVGNLNTGGVVAATGNVSGGNLTTGGVVAATGNVSGGNLTTGGVVAATGNVSGGNLTTAGALSVTGNANVGNLGTGGLITATGNVSGGNLTTGGIVNATGNIVSSANVVTDLIVGKTSSVTITATGSNQNVNLVPTGTGTVNVGNFIISNVQTPVNDFDAATKKYVDDVAQGLNIHDAVQAATPNTLAVITGGTITYNNGASGVGANLTTTGSFNLIDGVNVQTAGTRILVKNEANAVYNGIYTWSNATVITRATDYNTVPEVEAGDFVFCNGGTLYDNTGWVQTSSPTAIGTAGNTIEFTQFSGAGTYTAGTGLALNGSVFSIANTTVTAGAYGNGDYNATFTVNGQGQLTAAANVAITANAANLTGTTLASTIVNSSLTSVGTLTSLAVTGNATAGNVYANSGTIGASLLTGTLTTAAQPNVTSVGTLTSLTVTGTATAGNLSTGGTLSVTGNANVGNLGTGGLIVATGNVSGGNLTTAGVVAATGNVSGGNLTTAGVVAATGNVSGGNLTTAGVVAATGNVSGGNLTTAGALAVTGNASVGNLSATNGNLTTANVSGNIILGNASVTTAISWASATTSAITANQTIASFSVTGVTGVEFVVKGIDSTGSKYSVATVQAVTDGTNVDYSTFGTVNLGGFTGSLAVNVVGGFLRLQVTPASSNSTVWTTQYRFI